MCKRTMCKRARIPMFLWERRACANSGAGRFSSPPQKRPGNEANLHGTRPLVVEPIAASCVVPTVLAVHCPVNYTAGVSASVG